MQRILIIGSPGSGKSTLARKLAEILDLPCIHLDRLWWKPNWVQSSKDEFDTLLQTELEKECWIIEGNYSRTMQHRLKYADTVIWLDYPTIICLWRAFWRQGKKRPDMPENCIEKMNKDFFDFLIYIYNFKKNNYSRIKQLLENSNTDIVIIKNNKQLKYFENKIDNI